MKKLMTEWRRYLNEVIVGGTHDESKNTYTKTISSGVAIDRRKEIQLYKDAVGQEYIRGVAVNPQIIRNLIEFEWVKVVGHKETPGRPELLSTTKKFLDYFNMKSLSGLPKIEDSKN